MEVRLNGRVYTCLEQLREQADEELFLFLEEWFDDRSYVPGHTSGSTGAPKEIQLSKADMRASARMTNAFFAIGRESVLLLCLSVSYIAGKMMVVRALEAGAELLTVKVSSHPLRICGQEDRPGCYGADAGGGIYEIGIGKTTLRVYSSSDYRRGSGIRGFRRTVEKNSDTMLRYIWNDRDGVSYRLEKVE